jgi:hypothetical protein
MKGGGGGNQQKKSEVKWSEGKWKVLGMGGLRKSSKAKWRTNENMTLRIYYC